MYFHTDSYQTVASLSAVLNDAYEQGQRVRIDVDTQGNLRIKRGEGIWSPPFASTPDPYREMDK